MVVEEGEPPRLNETERWELSHLRMLSEFLIMSPKSESNIYIDKHSRYNGDLIS